MRGVVPDRCLTAPLQDEGGEEEGDVPNRPLEQIVTRDFLNMLEPRAGHANQ